MFPSRIEIVTKLHSAPSVSVHVINPRFHYNTLDLSQRNATKKHKLLKKKISTHKANQKVPYLGPVQRVGRWFKVGTFELDVLLTILFHSKDHNESSSVINLVMKLRLL